MDIKIDLTDTVVQTKRLILRYWKESDLSDFFAYASEPGVGEMAGWPHHKSIDESREILDNFRQTKNVFAIAHRQQDKVIGSLGLHYSWASNKDEYRHLISKEIGFVLAKGYWGQGLIPEAVQAVINYCFGELGIEILTSGHFSSNYQSKRVIEKCGFKYIETAKYYSEPLNQNFAIKRYILKKPQ